MIKFNHKEEMIPQAMNISRGRECELDDIMIEAMKSDETHGFTQVIEYIVKHSDAELTEAEYVYIGFAIGIKLGQKKEMIKRVEAAIKRELE